MSDDTASQRTEHGLGTGVWISLWAVSIVLAIGGGQAAGEMTTAGVIAGCALCYLSGVAAGSTWPGVLNHV